MGGRKRNIVHFTQCLRTEGICVSDGYKEITVKLWAGVSWEQIDYYILLSSYLPIVLLIKSQKSVSVWKKFQSVALLVCQQNS